MGEDIYWVWKFSKNETDLLGQHIIQHCYPCIISLHCHRISRELGRLEELAMGCSPSQCLWRPYSSKELQSTRNQFLSPMHLSQYLRNRVVCIVSNTSDMRNDLPEPYVMQINLLFAPKYNTTSITGLFGRRKPHFIAWNMCACVRMYQE